MRAFTLVVLAVAVLLAGCGGDSTKRLSSVAGGLAKDPAKLRNVHIGPAASRLKAAASKVNAAVGATGDPEENVICFIVKNSTVDGSGKVTLPPTSEIEQHLLNGALPGARTRNALRTINQLSGDVSANELSKLAVDAGCDLQVG